MTDRFFFGMMLAVFLVGFASGMAFVGMVLELTAKATP